MANASLVPSLDADIHLALCRFGRAGLAYIETDPAEADATTVVQNLLQLHGGAQPAGRSADLAPMVSTTLIALPHEA